MKPTVLTLIVSALMGTSVTSPAAEYATVVSSTPVVVSVPVARRVCNDEQQLVQPRQTGAGAVLGAIVGGVIGHNVGGGMGRVAATGLGVVAGSVIGDQVEANTAQPYPTTVRNCRNVSSLEERTVGFDVMYDYAGQRYSTRVPRDPGARMAIDVRPAASANSADDGPPASVYGIEAQPFTPAPVYYAPVPAAGTPGQPLTYASPYAQPYYGPYIVPSISLGFGYYGGWRGGRHGR